jgi:hypothetical protein
MSDENKPGVGAFVRDQDADAAISDIPKNRTMMVSKLTGDPAIKPEIVDGLTNVGEVFEHFKPAVEIDFEDIEGNSQKEELQFRNLGHFGRKGIIKQSKFLQDLQAQETNYQDFLKKLKSNKILQSMLADPDAKASYVAALQTLLDELNAAEPGEE